MASSQSYEVYLTEAASADFDGESIRADRVDFYDSGAWVSHADGRDFFPYERILRVREGAETEEGSQENRGQETGERRDAASGTSGSVDEANLDVE